MTRREVLQGMSAAMMLSTASGLEAQASGAKSDVVYELRGYHANEGNLAALVARFRDHTDAICKRDGMKSVAYWLPTDEPLKGRTLIYILKHPSRAAAASRSKRYYGGPESVKGSTASEGNQ